MCILDTRMEKKPTQFDYIVADVIANIDRWNNQVKQKEYIINNDDSFPLKEAKIYRCLNNVGCHRSSDIKPNIISSPELYKILNNNNKFS